MIQSSVWEAAVSHVSFDVAAAELKAAVMCGRVQPDRKVLLKWKVTLQQLCISTLLNVVSL